MSDFAIDGAGNLYLVSEIDHIAPLGTGVLLVADDEHGRIRSIDLASNLAVTCAGNGTDEYSGDGGPAESSSTWRPATTDRAP